MMKEIRNEVKNMIIAQNGTLYNYNLLMLAKKYGCSSTDIQNVANYFRFSKQQESFRAKYNFN